MEYSSRRRVKVYQLDDEGRWDDRGTGHVACLYVEKLGSLCLVVKSEDDPSILLESKISNDLDVYQRQQDTLIVWNDPESNVDLALSFLEAAGCQEIWDQMMSIQQKQSSETFDEQDQNTSQEVDEDSIAEPVDDPHWDLPPANVNNIERILQTIASANTVSKKERLTLAFLKEDYIRKLLALFNICEGMEDKAVLHNMFNIFKHLVLLNETNLLEVLFSEEFMIQMMGVFEYDPDIAEHNRMKHREFLTKHAIFKQVITFSSQELIERIHQTFRMQYLKDVVLNRVLDDSTFATLNSLVFFNNVEIVTKLQSDSKFLSELFNLLNSEVVASSQRKDLLLFLQELCTLAKSQQPTNRTQFYRSLCEQGLFDIFSTSLNDDQVATRMASTEIILITLGHDPSLLRSFIVRQKPDHSLLKLLIEKFTADVDLGVKSQALEILKVLIDTELPAEEVHLKDDFLNVFYQGDFIHRLVLPLKRKSFEGQHDAGDLNSGFVQNGVLELLSYCVRHHTFRIKYFLLGNNIIKKVLKLLTCRDKFIVLAAIRFFRAVIGMKDDFYNRHIIKYNLFAPLVDIFEHNGSTYNLLNSAIVELFDFLKKENVKLLIPYVVENFRDMMKRVDYVDVFHHILLKYDQMRDVPQREVSPIPSSNGPRKSHKQQEDEDEEAYFNDSDEEDEETGVVGKKRSNHASVSPLVDYEVDDDEPLGKSSKTEEHVADSDRDVQNNLESFRKGLDRTNGNNGPVAGRLEFSRTKVMRERLDSTEDDLLSPTKKIRMTIRDRSPSPPRSPPLSPRSPSPPPLSPNSPLTPPRRASTSPPTSPSSPVSSPSSVSSP